MNTTPDDQHHLHRTPEDWALRMRWLDLLFAHWPMPADVVQRVVPAPLVVDTFEGKAWVGIVPFRMEEVRLRNAPPIPFASAFPEVNVRTYVRIGEVTAVYFLSLDADSSIVVAAARTSLDLPYFHATMECEAAGVEVRYRSHREHPGAEPADLECNYLPTGEPGPTKPGSLDHWLTERHSLVNVDSQGRVMKLDVHHEPWQLQKAKAGFTLNTLARAAGLDLPDVEPMLHFSRDLMVHARMPEQIG